MYDQKLIMHDEDVYFVNMFIREVHIYNVDTLLIVLSCETLRFLCTKINTSSGRFESH